MINTRAEILELKNHEDNKGKLPAFAWPGGYPIIYLDGEGGVLCAGCASKEEDGFTPPAMAADIYYEGPVMQCDGCNCDIESAYGDPEETDNEAPV